MPKLSVFIPVYNEEKILESNVSRLYEALNRLGSKFELFIVDDSSTDSTPKIGEALSSNYPNIRIVRYSDGPSRRENLAKSFYLANGDLIMFMDADLSTDLKHIPELIEKMISGVDIVTGSRHLKNSVVERGFGRRFISKLFKYFMKFYFNSTVNDHECGFKLFKKSIILNLIGEMGYSKRRKFFWDAEMFIRAQKKGYKIKEIPITWVGNEKSSASFFKELSMVPYMLRLRSRL